MFHATSVQNFLKHRGKATAAAATQDRSCNMRLLMALAKSTSSSSWNRRASFMDPPWLPSRALHPMITRPLRRRLPQRAFSAASCHCQTPPPPPLTRELTLPPSRELATTEGSSRHRRRGSSPLRRGANVAATTGACADVATV